MLIVQRVARPQPRSRLCSASQPSKLSSNPTQRITLKCSNNFTKREQFVLISKLNSTNKAVPINFQINTVRRLLKDLSFKVNILHEKQISQQQPIYHGNTIGNRVTGMLSVCSCALSAFLTRTSISYLTCPILKLTTGRNELPNLKTSPIPSPLSQYIISDSQSYYIFVIFFSTRDEKDFISDEIEHQKTQKVLKIPEFYTYSQMDSTKTFIEKKLIIYNLHFKLALSTEAKTSFLIDQVLSLYTKIQKNLPSSFL